MLRRQERYAAELQRRSIREACSAVDHAPLPTRTAFQSSPARWVPGEHWPNRWDGEPLAWLTGRAS